MKRTEWNKQPTPLGTPQFSVTKGSSFTTSNENHHSESLVPANEKSFKMISKPAERKSETLMEILRLRNAFEETVNKIKKNYLQKERQVFQLIQNEDELKVLIATRPAILEVRSQVVPNSQGKTQGRFIDDYRTGFRPVQAEVLKRTLQEENENKRKELVVDLENFLNAKTESCRKLVEDYWTNRIEDLEDKLMQLEEWPEDHEKNVDVEEIREELEEKYRKELDRRRSQRKVPVLSKKEREALILKLEAEIEIQQINELENEKKSWGQEEVKKVKKMCEEKWREEQDLIVQKKEKDLKKQAERETRDVLNNLSKDFEEVSSENIKKISESLKNQQNQIEDLLQEEAYQELINEAQENYREQSLEKVKTLLEKDLKKNLSQRIEMEVKIRLEDSIYSELNENFEENHEIFRKKIEQEQAAKLLDLEYQCEVNRGANLQSTIDKKFSKTEKELKINFFKKLDKLKSDLRKEYEEIYIGQIKKIRTLLIQEKSEAARIKSQINVYVSKTSNEKAAQIKSLQDQEDLYGRRVRDLSIRQQLEIEHSAFKATPENSKSPLRKSNTNCSASPLIPDSEVSRTIPKPLPPPTLVSFNDESRKKEQSPERRLLKVYDTKEIANSLIMKNYEEAHKQAWLTLKETEEPLKIDNPRPKSTYAEISEMLSSGKTLKIREEPKRHSLYNELLKKKYGVIEPRTK
jgi:hypothetical protein